MTLARWLLRPAVPLLADLYRDSRATGSLILIDPADNATAGAGMIRSIADAAETESQINRDNPRVARARQSRASWLRSLSTLCCRQAPLCFARAFPCRPRWSRFARLGAFVLVESDDVRPITLTAVHVANTTPRELAVDAAGRDPQ